MMKKQTLTLLLLTTAFVAFTATAQPVVTEAWVRSTVAQQKATGLFAQITHPKGARLVGASSPVAGVVEIHEMAMDGDVMRMRALTALELPAGKRVELRPGGHHLMLLDLKRALKPGETVPVTLVFEGAGKQRETLVVQAPVKAMDGTAGGSGMGMGKP
jgi:periplasmic copper chaperone A